MLFEAVALCFLCALSKANGASFSGTSSVSCQDTSYATQACVLQNVVVWNGRIYAVASESATADEPKQKGPCQMYQKQEINTNICITGPLAIPDVRLDTFHKPKLDQADLQLKDILQVVQPNALPFSTIATVNYAAGGAFKRTHTHNWFHSLTEDSANYAARICKYLGLCKYGDFHGPGKDFLLVFLDGQGQAYGNFKDIHNCWGRSISLDEPHVNEAYSVERLLVGVGNECNPPHCYLPEDNQMQPLSKASTQTWISFMRECAGLPAQPPRHTADPRVTFIDRAYNSGRSVLNMGHALQVFAHFNNKRKKLYSNTTFELHYMEGLHWKDSAAIYAASDIVITPHGAQMCNLIFQPMQSEFVHISAARGHFDLNRWVALNAAAYTELGEDGVLWPRGNVVDMQKVIASHGGKEAWSKEDMVWVLENEKCPKTHPDPGCTDINLFSRHVHFNPAKPLLIAKVEDALHRWHQRRKGQAAELMRTE